MGANNINTDSEYKGSSPSPPPGKPDTNKAREILEETKSQTYQVTKELKEKHDENFPTLPMSISALSNLQEMFSMKKYSGEGSGENSDSNSDSPLSSISSTISSVSSNMSNLTEAIKSTVSASTELANGIKSIGDSSSTKDRVKQAASKYINVESKEGSALVDQITSEIEAEGSINTSSASDINNFITKVQNLQFLNLSAIDFASITTDERSNETVEDPEAIITTASLDDSASDDNTKMQNLYNRYTRALNSLISSIGSSSDVAATNTGNSLNAVSISNYQLGLLASNIASYQRPKKVDVSDLPEEWRPEYHA